MDHHSSVRESAGTAAPVRRTGGEGAAREGHYTERRLRTVAQAALLGGPLFLLGTVLHPERYGEGIAAAGYIYGITHDVQAFGLLLQAISLVSVYVLGAWRFGRGGVPTFFAALIGTLLWFGLIVTFVARQARTMLPSGRGYYAIWICESQDNRRRVIHGLLTTLDPSLTLTRT